MNVQILVTEEDLQMIRRMSNLALRPDPIITVCAWCPTKETNDRILKANGFKVSHGLCTACLFAQTKELDAIGGDKPAARHA